MTRRNEPDVLDETQKEAETQAIRSGEVCFVSRFEMADELIVIIIGLLQFRGENRFNGLDLVRVP